MPGSLRNYGLDNLKQNLERIDCDGKHADVIVKGLLQHSRSSITVKELTEFKLSIIE